MNQLADLLSISGYIQVNKKLIKLLGLHEAILIGELCSEYIYYRDLNKLDNDFFFSTRENIEDNTGLNEHYQRKAFSHLKELNLIIIERKGLPSKNYYKICFEKLYSMLSPSPLHDEGLQVHDVNLNNNKSNKNKIENKKVLPKGNTTGPEFNFGKPKQQKQNLYSKCMSVIMDKTDNYELRQLLVNWLDMLLEKYKWSGRQLYINVFKGKLNMLDKYDVKDWKEIIEYTLQKGYEGFYPIRNYNYKQGKSPDGLDESESMTEQDYINLKKVTEERKRNGLRTSF